VRRNARSANVVRANVALVETDSSPGSCSLAALPRPGCAPDVPICAPALASSAVAVARPSAPAEGRLSPNRLGRPVGPVAPVHLLSQLGLGRSPLTGKPLFRGSDCVAERSQGAVGVTRPRRSLRSDERAVRAIPEVFAERPDSVDRRAAQEIQALVDRLVRQEHGEANVWLVKAPIVV